MNCCFVIHTRRRRINRKKVVATESALRGRACKPLADGSVLFCGKGAMTQRLKIPLGLSERDHNREVHRDVAEMERFELSRRFTHPTPLAGEPLRPTWVHLRIKHIFILLPRHPACSEKMAEKVGFEPTVPFGITGFQDQLLKPLGHLSTSGQRIGPRLAQHLWQTP